MLSLILYGRNDNYGYNLHKRAAISLNCMAEILDDAEDEILFVDYNTPDDYPTFPEAIGDTLTAKVKRHLRILRVRPSVHARFADRTHLVALEPIARNVALRRSNPANRWILSTNTDMIFVPRGDRSLSDIVGALPDGHYGLPRFEVPETLWEGLDRRDARHVLEALERWGRVFHLNEVVAAQFPMRFDGPGDFQLALRSDLVAIRGFHERMLLGWHVDANLAKRMSLLRGEVGDLSDMLLGYHCDHTRQITPAHRGDAVQNDSAEFFERVERPDLPEQAADWGCPEDDIEEIHLDRPNAFATALGAVLPIPAETFAHSAYVPETFGKTGYDAAHVLPFLLDLLASAPRNTTVAWFGAHHRMFRLFAQAWRGLDDTAAVMVPTDMAPLIGPADDPERPSATLDELFDVADVFVFDFASADGTPLASAAAALPDTLGETLLAVLDEAVIVEKNRRRKNRPPRRFVGINAIHNRFEQPFAGQVGVARTPFNARLRHGFAIMPAAAGAAPLAKDAASATAETERSENWLPRLLLGPAGDRRGPAIYAASGVSGHVAYGPYALLPPGHYRVDVDLVFGTGHDLGAVARRWARRVAGRRIHRLAGPALTIEISAASENILARSILDSGRAASGRVCLEFDIDRLPFRGRPDQQVEVRIHTDGRRSFTVTAVQVHALPRRPVESSPPLIDTVHRMDRVST